MQAGASRGSWLYLILPYLEQTGRYSYRNGGSSPLSEIIPIPVEPSAGGNWFNQPEPYRWARRNGANMHDIASGMAAPRPPRPAAGATFPIRAQVAPESSDR